MEYARMWPGANVLVAGVLVASLLAVAKPARAEEQPVTVTIDRAKVFRIQEPASTVIIGNPFIADVAMHDDTTVVITGKSYGTTNLIILDEDSTPIIDELITVQAADENDVTVVRKTVRQTFSCTPNCQPVIRLGDGPDAFTATAEQAAERNDLATQAAAAGAPRSAPPQ
ncbi:hypothetical protein GCM10011316_31840 [Roseibium aquae]|uniref:Pilus formation protein N-terminal domain-containing protein n=1 Tax=Roseibium aquae TaxID=1323746 RepID=A0A916TLY2_9HYPH|nr:pilus assembly protein N-terminal domain-containing protein [Roseibium aquae]GGB57376.1 hypothetical protein GCM10011316_31840 [Roseibium aquae]